MKSTKLVCHKIEPGKYRHFYPNEVCVKMCGNGDIKKVTVTEDANGNYWAWWDNERQSFLLVYSSKLLVDICFPGGVDMAEKLGKGHLLQVSVTEDE